MSDSPEEEPAREIWWEEEIRQEILAELGRRCSITDPRDVLAIATAVSKSFALGYRRACERSAFEAVERWGEPIALEEVLVEVRDYWAEEYGE